MPVESWIHPEETPAMAADAVGLIDVALSRLPAADREAFWASIRKCYNTPYNDPAPRDLAACETPAPVAAIEIAISEIALPEIALTEVTLPEVTLPMAAIPTVAPYGVETHVG